MEKNKIVLSKKQNQLRNDIIAENIEKIYVEGSVQSGKTFDICNAIIEYAQRLNDYDADNNYMGGIIGWTYETIKGNIIEPLENLLTIRGYKKKVRGIGDYELNDSNADIKYLKLWNIKFLFFGFDNVKSFNKILRKAIIIYMG